MHFVYLRVLETLWLLFVYSILIQPLIDPSDITFFIVISLWTHFFLPVHSERQGICGGRGGKESASLSLSRPPSSQGLSFRT